MYIYYMPHRITQQAFNRLITELDEYKKLEMNDSTVRSIRKLWKDGKRPIGRVYELLEIGDYKMVQELRCEKKV